MKKIDHLDIKPLNLLLDKDNNIKVSDFGLSGIIPIISEVSTTLKLSNQTGGTEYYFPPEAIKSPKRSFKFDIWAFGITLYYMAQSKLPFTVNNSFDFRQNLITTIPKELDNTYSKELNFFIKRLLSKDPIKRPSAKEAQLLIPNSEKEKYEKPKGIFNMFLDIFMLSLGYEMPPEIKEEFNELYSIVSEFPDFPIRNLRYFDCKKIPMITINYEKLSVSSLCEGGHYRNINMRDYFKIFLMKEMKLEKIFAQFVVKKMNFIQN